MGRKKQASSLGNAIIKDRFGGGRKVNKESHLHTSELNDGYDWGRLNLQSVTEQSNLDEFLATAELAGTEFTAEKLNVSIVHSEKHTGLLTDAEEKIVKDAQEENKMFLSIPRRPEWDDSTSPEELDQMERDSFLEWRRKLAELQEKDHIVMTPFERNLDFWRQLWRVVERSDVIVQIVDARNPLLFYCEDLWEYVNTQGKVNALLINKADLLTEAQRESWANYMEEKGITVAFWSAFLETERIKTINASVEEVVDKAAEEMSDELSEEEGEDTDSAEEAVESTMDKLSSMDTQDDGRTEHIGSGVDSEDCDTEQKTTENECDQRISDQEECNCPSSTETTNETSDISIKGRLLNGQELLDYLTSLSKEKQVTEGVTTIGLVGYPNVGKSSTINAILQTKKVPVSATPGRTKHFQTLYVDKETLLCDCPGLVMPTFVSTKADMVVSGILPIDQMRDHIPPISLVCRHIPKPVLEATYGILLPKPKEGEDPDRLPTAHELLGTYGMMRGFMTHKGVPDFPRSARCILKDYVNGKLLYCHPPPTVSVEEFRPCPEPVVKERKQKYSAVPTQKSKPDAPVFTNEVDRQFFSRTESKINSKGRHGVEMYTRKVGFTQHHSGSVDPTPNGSLASVAGKPWKRHGNRGKKEKLRRKHRDLDVHSNF